MRQLSKEVKAIIAVIILLWSFAMGWALGSSNGYKKASAEVNQTQQTQNTQPSNETTTQPSTSVPTTSQPASLEPTVIPSTSGGDDNTTTSAVQQQPSNDPSSLSEAQIIEKMNTYVSKLKAEQNFTAHKAESVKIEVVDFSIPSAISIINNIINGLAGDEEITYTFTNGTEPGGGTPNSLIPPTGKNFNLTEAGVKTATAKKDGDNTVYTVTLEVEDTTADAPVPAQNSTVIGYLDLTTIDLPSMVKITKANMHYPGSTVEVVVNSNDQVVKLVNKMPMTGEGGASVFGAEGTASFQGGLDETWTFTY